MEKKKVLVYPCGTEIGLEIFHALRYAKQYELYGGSSTYDHGRFVYERHIDDLPFLTDASSEEDVLMFGKLIRSYGIDCIYPAMDGVVTLLSRYRDSLSPIIVVAPSYEATSITRSKRRTYELLAECIPVPKLYNSKEEVETLPVFTKPSVGQGSNGAYKITLREDLDDPALFSQDRLVMEYLPGEEYTVDCFTNQDGKLLYCQGRRRKRIKDGISVNSVFCYQEDFLGIAERINGKLQQTGAWFFQVREDGRGQLKLLEVASRIAGSSGINRSLSVNLPLLTVDMFAGKQIEDIVVNLGYDTEVDRSLGNVFRLTLAYDNVYMDYDDTVVQDGKVNTEIIKFLYQCINRKKRIVLLTRHEGTDLVQELKDFRLYEVFDEIIHLDRKQSKADYVCSNSSIFIDDSYGERRDVAIRCRIPVFDTCMVECLLEG